MLTPRAKARFFASFVPEPNSGCWLWTGRLNEKGYAYFAFKSKWMIAHRLSYRMAKGEIPKPLEIDHKCRVRCCVNPDHLEAVVHVENCRRGKPVHQTHCKRGHPLAGENVA